MAVQEENNVNGSKKRETGTKRETFRKLFVSTFRLSACTFGGGFVIVPLMRKKFVEELHWIGEQEMLDLTAIAQSAPGAIAVNASILVGYRVAGIMGALTTMLGTVLPPLLIISAISVVYGIIRDNAIVNMAMTGMMAGVAAVICDVVITLGKGLLQQKRIFPPAVFLASFLAVRFWQVDVIRIIAVCAVLGALDAGMVRRRKERERREDSGLSGTAVEFSADRAVQHRRRIRGHAAD